MAASSSPSPPSTAGSSLASPAAPSHLASPSFVESPDPFLRISYNNLATSAHDRVHVHVHVHVMSHGPARTTVRGLAPKQPRPLRPRQLNAGEAVATRPLPLPEVRVRLAHLLHRQRGDRPADERKPLALEPSLQGFTRPDTALGGKAVRTHRLPRAPEPRLHLPGRQPLVHQVASRADAGRRVHLQ